jgi:hypothetical protein
MSEELGLWTVMEAAACRVLEIEEGHPQLLLSSLYTVLDRADHCWPLQEQPVLQ